MYQNQYYGYDGTLDTEGYDLIMRPEAAMEALGLSRNTFYKLANEGKIPGAFRIGKQWRVYRSELERGMLQQ